MSKEETIKELAEQALKEINPEQLAELMKDEVNIKIAEIMAAMGTKKESIGPVEFSIKFGRACYDLGQENAEKWEAAKKELTESK